MDLGLINAFLSSETNNETEKLVQMNVQNLNQTYTKLATQRNELLMSLKKCEEDLLKFSGALENQLSMAEFLARQKGLQPVELQSPTVGEAEQSQVDTEKE